MGDKLKAIASGAFSAGAWFVIVLFVGVLFHNAAKTNFGAINIQVPYPEGPSKEQRDALNAEMDQYHNPVALFKLLAYNERALPKGGK